ncbi:ParB N-terminal domain-containing protein [Kaistia dalseonensis]|uniref:ParB family chromosome partitioning protein n=1 Tax=Kaistia dalseonensis TaxID=410840 RepID=A0ABU0H7S9_9HYPH|nr:ParB/RepB/Spo0J family partition protein [Kaistia dalseonensis]MCX5495763.1 ParB N-terminal domain-containing protein [Kaistia dalseonensis]MDQ0438363.1 ParB family chromosome partitioning protein [Kaistia dalseonensis]
MAEASTLIPLNLLRFGHEADPPINARTKGRNDDIDGMAASLQAHGQIHPLVVKSLEGGIFVSDGNRRLAGFFLLAKEGSIRADHPVKCEEIAAGADAKEISLAANVIREALHPADEYVAFMALAEDGLGEADIARRFGIDPRNVSRMLALGRLSPNIIDAWRAGAFGDSRNEMDCVRAFTLAPSLAEQDAVYEQLAKAGRFWPEVIRAQFGAGDRAAIQNLQFVGKRAYLAAGGSLVEDLFGTNHAISDPGLLKDLMQAKLKAECERLIGEGWSWAELDWELPPSAYYGWSRTEKAPARGSQAELALRAELNERVETGTASEDDIQELRELKRELQLRPYTDEEREASGVIVRLDGAGHLDLRPGVVKPAKATASASAAEDAGGAESKVPTISNAMMHRLSIKLTEATQQAIAEEPRVGLVALLSGFLSHEAYSDPIRVQRNGYGRVTRRPESVETFGAIFARLSAMTDGELFAVAAGIAARAVDLQRMSVDQPPLANEGIAALLGAMNGERLEGAIRQTFDAADYFGGISKPLVAQAIHEAGFAEDQVKTAKMKKGDVVAFAIANVPGTGWLPPEFRTAHYAGPGRAG